MPPIRRRIAPLAGLALLLAPLAGCHQDGGGRPYTVARPPAPAQPIRPVRIGGYAGHNYGPPAPVVEPIR